MENINDYLNRIIQISFDNLPVKDGWSSFTVEAMVIRKFVEINAFYLDEHGERKSFNPKYPNANDRNDDLTFLLLDMRKAMFDIAPNKGGWFTCRIEVKADGNFHTKYDYDNKPLFAYEPVDEKYTDDYKHFPREKELIPDWLKVILSRNNIVV